MAKKQEVNESGLRQLKQDIKTGNFGRLYFFYGEEQYLREYYLQTLIKKTVSGPMMEFNYRRLTAENFSVEALIDAVEAMPMMADYTLVQVDDFNPFAQAEDVRETLVSVFSDLPDTCCLVFNFDTVSYRRDGKMKKLAAAIDGCGVEVEFYKQSPSELAEWITRHFRALEKAITPDLCQYLIFLTGGTMTTMHSEIGKIAAYCKGQNITRQDIDAVVEPVLSAVLFDITDALAEENYDKALVKLQEVIKGREDPIAILATVGAHFRRLLTAKTVAAAGKGADALMELFGTNSDFFCRKVMSQSARLSEAFCLRAVELCYEADCRIKRSYQGGEDIVELLLLTLAQEGRR